VKKTKEAVSVLRRLNVWPDIEKVVLKTEKFVIIHAAGCDGMGMCCEKKTMIG